MNLELENGTIGSTDKTDIRMFTNIIIEHLYGNKESEEKEGLVNVMGGNIILTEAIIARNEGRVEGRAEGRAEGRTEGRTEGADQLLKALTLLRSRECVSVQDLIDKSIEENIAEMAMHFTFDSI